MQTDMMFIKGYWKIEESNILLQYNIYIYIIKLNTNNKQYKDIKQLLEDRLRLV